MWESFPAQSAAVQIARGNLLGVVVLRLLVQQSHVGSVSLRAHADVADVYSFVGAQYTPHGVSGRRHRAGCCARGQNNRAAQEVTTRRLAVFGTHNDGSSFAGYIPIREQHADKPRTDLGSY